MTQESDLKKAAPIVNQNGDWGWATIVLEVDDLDLPKWQRFMDEARRLHIQPIIRLATNFENGSWRRPTQKDIDDFADFFSKLNWPTKNLPVILFNEINHSTEWGGEVDIKNYLDIATFAVKRLKSSNPNLVLMSAALDLSAPEKPPKYKSAESVYTELVKLSPNFFDNFQALASHSYPNPGFSGLPTDTGKKSILGYQWELEIIEKDLPVFITETGWPFINFTRNTTSEFNTKAHQIWLSDQRIQAITYFIFNYPYPPFEKFSWVDQSETLYPEYQNLKDMDKGKNLPKQIQKIEYINHRLPLIFFSDYALEGEIELKNTGQTIWGDQNKCFDPLPNDFQSIPLCTDNLVEPGQSHIFNFTFRIPKNYPHDIKLEWAGVKPLVFPKLSSTLDIYQGRDTIFVKIRKKIQKLLKYDKSP